MAGKGASMLEANPGALAVVILFFLVFTLGFEHLLHWARHQLLRRKKYGMLAALNNFASEIMLLGLASLLLMVCEKQISTICYPVNTTANSALQPWLSRVVGHKGELGCACCLARTNYVSKCFLEDKKCYGPEYDKVCKVSSSGIFAGLNHKPAVITDKSSKAYNATNSNTTTPDSPCTATNSPTTTPDSPYTGGSNGVPGATPGSPYTGGSNGVPGATPGSPYTGGSNGVPGATPGSSQGVPEGHRRRQRRRLAAEPAEEDVGEEKQCVGRKQKSYAECKHKGEGYAPVVTVKTLHQVHMLLFFMAVTHIVVGVIVLLISTAKLKFYVRRGSGEKEDKVAAKALQAAQTEYDNKLLGLGTVKSIPEEPPTGAHAVNLGGKISPEEQTSAFVVAQAAASAGAAAAAAAAAAHGGAAAAHGGGGKKDAAAAAASPVLSVTPWNGRPEELGWVDWLLEGLLYFVRQVLMWRTVSKQEYSVLRASFYYTHAATVTKAVRHSDDHAHGDDSHGHDDQHDFQEQPSLAMSWSTSSSSGAHHFTGLRPDHAQGAYGPYVIESVERDGGASVGLGLPMWLLLLAFVLISGVLGWATWLFLVVAGALQLLLNVMVLSTLRHMTQGGHVVRQQEAWFHWMYRTGFLAAAIKLTLFFFTFVISNAIFMAVTFGPESCFFSRTGFQNKVPVPMWVILVVDVLLLVNLSMVTLPLYSLTTHTLRVDKALLQSIVRDRKLQKETAAFQKSIAHNTPAHGKGGHGHGGGGGAGFRNSLKRTLTTNRTRNQPQVAARQDQAPVSDNHKWQLQQEALSV